MVALYLIFGLLVALLEAWPVYKAIKNTRRARLLARVPWSKTGQLQPGLVKVRGRALAVGGTLRSPLSERECVYYHFQVQEEHGNVGGAQSGRYWYWKTVLNDAQAVPYAVDDGTGSATVRMKSAELVLRPDAIEWPGSRNGTRPELKAMLKKRYGFSTVVWLFFERTLKYRETRIHEGDILLVLGTAREVSGGGWELVRGRAPLLVSDKGLAVLLASYRSAAFSWWCLAVLVLLPFIAGVAAILY